MKTPFLPNEILLENYLEPLDNSQNIIARAIGVLRREIHEIVLEKRAAMTAMPIRFGVVVALFLGVSCENCLARPVTLIRATPESVEWLGENESIVECYRKDLNPPADSKIVPLFLCVQLMLGDPVSEFGARLTEIAFVYSEIRQDGGSVEKKILVFVRSPYEVRVWKWEPILKLVEGEDSLEGFCELKDGGDRYAEISNYARKVTQPANSGEHIIYMTVYEKASNEFFGKKLDDDALLRIIRQE